MSENKNTDRMNTEKDLTKLIEQITEQCFETEEEMNDFLKKMQEQSINDLPGKTDKKGRSQDLVYEAHEQPVSKGKKLVKQALELDPDNADAYNYLASTEKNLDKATEFFEKAIEAGENTLGNKFIREEKGYFWGIFKTRPYMRAKAGLADCLYAKKEIDKAIKICAEMLELNPNDNQGMRYLLSTLLLSKKDLSAFERFMKKTEDENCAVWNYNKALYQFKKTGQTTKSDKALLKAYKSNEFVIDYMLGIKEMPDELPQYIGRGDKDEAVSYINQAWAIWEKTEGAFYWLLEFKKKRLKVN